MLWIFLIVLVVICIAAVSFNSSKNDKVDAPRIDTGIKMEHTITKKVDNKYRYFFSLENNGAGPFTGSVLLELVGTSGDVVRSDIFETTQVMESGAKTIVYTDAYTPPTRDMGKDAVQNFSYVVKSAAGEERLYGTITGEYEEL